MNDKLRLLNYLALHAGPMSLLETISQIQDGILEPDDVLSHFERIGLSERSFSNNISAVRLQFYMKIPKSEKLIDTFIDQIMGEEK